MRQRFLSREHAILSTKGDGGSGARSGQCLEAESGEKAGGADVPWVRNYERARAVVEGAEASCFFVLGEAHKSYLAMRSSPMLLRWWPICDRPQESHLNSEYWK